MVFFYLVRRRRVFPCRRPYGRRDDKGKAAALSRHGSHIVPILTKAAHYVVVGKENERW